MPSSVRLLPLAIVTIAVWFVLADSAREIQDGLANQKLANSVAAALRKVEMHSFEIEINVENATVELDGTVESKEHKASAGLAAGSVKGISHVVNRLRIGKPQFKFEG